MQKWPNRSPGYDPGSMRSFYVVSAPFANFYSINPWRYRTLHLLNVLLFNMTSMQISRAGSNSELVNCSFLTEYSDISTIVSEINRCIRIALTGAVIQPVDGFTPWNRRLLLVLAKLHSGLIVHLHQLQKERHTH